MISIAPIRPTCDSDAESVATNLHHVTPTHCGYNLVLVVHPTTNLFTTVRYRLLPLGPFAEPVECAESVEKNDAGRLYGSTIGNSGEGNLLEVYRNGAVEHLRAV